MIKVVRRGVYCIIKHPLTLLAHNLFDAAAGFGGYRESGFGRDGGKECLFEYTKPSWMPRARPALTDAPLVQ